ncbi:MAG: hypothetical protein V4682_02045 [Patescibacteria group bacterium]
MRKSGSITAILADKLGETPAAFQEYVKKYFAKQDICGTVYFVAFGADSRPDWKNESTKPGSAPSHSVDQAIYTEGLDGKSLSEWMREAAEQGSIWKFNATWDDGCASPIGYDGL